MMRAAAPGRAFQRLLRPARSLASSAASSSGEGGLPAAYASRVASGHLEDDEIQKKVVEFLAAALRRATAAAAGEGGGRPTAWAWPRETLGTGAAAAAEEDRRRVAAYTAQLAAQNARRAREQARGQRLNVGEASPASASTPTASVTSAPSAAVQAGTGGEAKPAAKPKAKPPRQSVYMHGPVGTGKTMLLDLFHDHAKEAGLRVRRKHFYEFMLGLHQQIHEIEEERPVEVAANRLADSVDVLCFDEFQITDIQDAAILPRLFEVLFLRGVVVSMTSNTSPQLLYSGGLNRHVHLPAFISLLAEHCTVLGLGGPGGRRAVDYRRRAEAAEAAELGEDAAGAFLSGPDAESRLRERWSQLLAGRTSQPRQLQLPMGRRLSLPEAAGDSCLANFQELCCTERGEADFLAIAEAFSTVLLSGVPRFASLEATDEVRRFVKLLDVFYDRRVRLVLATAGQPDELFEGVRQEVARSDAGDLAWRTALYSADGKAGMSPSAVGTLCEAVRATDRAESRLREMRTRRYWESCAREQNEE